RFIPRNLAGCRRISLRDSPLPGQPSLTAPDRETPDGRNGLRAAAGGKAGCKPGSEPRKRTDERECDGSRTWRTSGERVGAAAEGLRAAVATGVRKGLWMGMPGNGSTCQEGVRGVARPVQGPRPSTWRLF